jgi:mono/diheme cytochrome c family protein
MIRIEVPMARFFRKLFTALIVLGLAGATVFWFLTRPMSFAEAHWAGLGDQDIANGEKVFWAGGCVSCHAAPGAKDDAKRVLAGGLPLKSPFGTFHAMSDKDINDLWGFLRTLPKSSNVAPPHDLPFPFNIRLSLGGWKLLFFTDRPRVAVGRDDPKIARGQYLVEGPGHCGECHTPRNALGGFENGRWLAGAPNPEGKGRIPNITPSDTGIGAWSESEIVEYLTTGFTPEFDSAGGAMVAVVENMARLPAEDREAIAAYLKAVPAQ